MKHELSFKMPKWFYKKPISEMTEEEKAVAEERNEKLSKALRVGGPIALGVTIGYLAGYNRGVTRLNRHKGDLYIIK
jgi:hypothetical protein